MKKKRLLIYVALLAAFALACTVQLMPKLIARAEDCPDAAVGTASLTDEGDTVFVRMAKFTIGEQTIRAPGFVVANAAAGENPAAGVDFSALKPITVGNPLTGTLDKDICVVGDNAVTDLYLGDLTLTDGHQLYSKSSGLNLLGGKLTAPKIETPKQISIGSATVTVNSDLTGFESIDLFVSETANSRIASFGTPASLTVNGSVSQSNTKQSYAINVGNGSSLTITGDFTAKRILVAYADDNHARSSVKIGGNLTVTEGNMQSVVLIRSDAEIGGAIKANDCVNLNHGSTLKAKSVEATMISNETGGSFDIDGDVTLSNYLDCFGYQQTGVCRIGGDLKCSILNVVGRSADDREKLTVGGSVECEQFGSINGELSLGKGVTKTGGEWTSFFLYNTKAEIGGDVTGHNLDLRNATVVIHGNLTSKGRCVPVRDSTLTIDGDTNTIQFNPLGGSVIKIQGSLTEDSLLSLNDNASLEVGKDTTVSGQFGLNNGAKMTVSGDMTLHGENNAFWRGTELNVTGSVDCGGGPFNAIGSKVTIGGDLTNASSIDATNDWTYGGSTITVNGDAVSNDHFTLNPNSTIQTGRDFIYNDVNGKIEGNMIVGRDFVCQKSTNLFPAMNGVRVSGKLQVGRDVLMNNLLLNCDSYLTNLDVNGMIVAHRIADIVKVSGHTDEPYVIEGTSYETNRNKFSYTVPFDQQVVPLTIGGENYVTDIRDISNKEFTPIRAGDSFTITYELDGGAFRADAVIAESYNVVIGADLPAENQLEKRIGFLFGGWYDNAEYTGAPVTQIPEGTVGDMIFYLKWNACDHAASTAQPTCAETAICTICGAEIPTAPHQFTVSLATVAPTCVADGYTTYQCEFCTEMENRDFVPALGHVLACDEWVWEADYSSATAKCHCTRCSDTVELTDNAPAQTVVSEQDCTHPEISIYTATVTNDDQTFTDTTEPIQTKDALGHDDGRWQIDFEATPDHDGQKSLWCNRCGALLETETFAQHTHETGFERTLTPATCTEDGEKGLYCTHCNALYDVEAIPATGHDEGVWKVDFEPTADHDGQKTRYCTKCGAALEQETFTQHDHTLGYEVTLTPATCTVDGEKGLVCADCGAVYATEAIPAAGHVDGVERTLTPATCTADGEKATCCDVCGEIIKTEAIPATGHTPGAACILTPATCTGDGEKGVYCDTCGEVIEVEAIPAAGHDEGVWKVDFEPTPEHDGQKTRYCTKCGAALETETFSAHTHTLGYETVTRKATCTKDGEKGLVCATCGVVYATEVIPAKGHTEGYQRIVTPATCTEPGVMGTFCATCGQRYAVTEIAATGHAFGAWYQNGDGTHSRDCTRCQLKETANCKYTATVTEPTCTEEGFTTYVCDDCGYTYVDDHVDPLGHDWSAWTDDENDETHSHVCARCGETETEAHNFGPWVFNDDASFFKNGTKTRTCGDCGCAETEEAAHTSTIARILLPPILWLLSLVRKVVFTGSFLWYLPWLNLFPKM